MESYCPYNLDKCFFHAELFDLIQILYTGYDKELFWLDFEVR